GSVVCVEAFDVGHEGRVAHRHLVALRPTWRPVGQGRTVAPHKKDYVEAGQRVVYWRAATWEMRPDTDPDFLAYLKDARKDDPASFDSEYGAEFRRDIEAFTSIEQVDAVTVTGRVYLPYDAKM